MKRITILFLLLTVLASAPLRAQEKEPLVMRVMVDWTAGGIIAGIVVGTAIWLTDPGKKGNKLSDQAARGAAWGALAGAVFALTVANNTAIGPAVVQASPGPLHPAMRITSDPIADEEQRQHLLASSGGAGSFGGKSIVLPLLNLRF